MDYKRGDILSMGPVDVVILGGPTKICHSWYYTIQYLGDIPNGNGGVMEARGVTTLMPYYHGGQIIRHDLSIIPRESNVIYGYCPECDEDEMIFYEGDYICGWCREHLEDGL